MDLNHFKFKNGNDDEVFEISHFLFTDAIRSSEIESRLTWKGNLTL